MTYKYYAYIDIIGFKDSMVKEQNNADDSFKNRLISSFEFVRNINIAEISIKSISDSIFCVFNKEERDFVDFVDVLNILQVEFLKNGILVRGGISYNKHFETTNVTHSLALLDAYNLESTEAFFPRILIHSSVIEKLKNANLFNSILLSKKIVKHGNKYQLNYLTPLNWNECYDLHKKIHNENEVLILSAPGIFAKYWYLHCYLKKFANPGVDFVRYLTEWD